MIPFFRSPQGLHKIWEPLSGFILAAGAGLVFCMFLALLTGVNPLDLVSVIWHGGWGDREAAMTSLGKTTPLLLTGLAVSLAYRANLLNIGCEGQLTLGALAAASFAIHASALPKALLMPLTILAGAFVGGLWAYPAVWMRQRRNVHEVISTLLMNYMAAYLAEYLVLGPLGDGSAMGRTAEISAGAIWPPLWEIGGLRLTAAPFSALLLTALAHFFLKRTVWGYEVTATGSNPAAAQASGIPVSKWQRRVFVMSGALAGLAGALEVVAVHHRFYRAFSPGYGFDGITASFLVDSIPGWLWLSALLLAGLRTADKWLQLALGVSPNAVLIIQAVLLLSVACRGRFKK